MIGFAPEQPTQPQDGAEAAAWRLGQWNALLSLCANVSGLIAASGPTVAPRHLWLMLAAAVADPVLGDLDARSLDIRAQTLALLREQVAKAEAAETTPPAPAPRPTYTPGGYL